MDTQNGDGPLFFRNIKKPVRQLCKMAPFFFQVWNIASTYWEKWKFKNSWRLNKIKTKKKNSPTMNLLIDLNTNDSDSPKLLTIKRLYQKGKKRKEIITIINYTRILLLLRTIPQSLTPSYFQKQETRSGRLCPCSLWLFSCF